MEVEAAKAAAKRLFQKANFSGGSLQSYEISSLLTDTYEYLKIRTITTTQLSNRPAKISKFTHKSSTLTKMDKSLFRTSKHELSNTSVETESSINRLPSQPAKKISMLVPPIKPPPSPSKLQIVLIGSLERASLTTNPFPTVLPSINLWLLTLHQGDRRNTARTLSTTSLWRPLFSNATPPIAIRSQLTEQLLCWVKPTRCWGDKGTSPTLKTSKSGWSSATQTTMGMCNARNTINLW